MREPVLRPEPVIRALQGAFARDVPRGELLALGARQIHEAGPPYEGAAVYLAGAGAFVLTAQAGDASWPPRFPTDGAADDPTAGSILSMPIVLRTEVLGAIAVRSGQADAFGPAEETALREIADALAVLL